EAGTGGEAGFPAPTHGASGELQTVARPQCSFASGPARRLRAHAGQHRAAPAASGRSGVSHGAVAIAEAEEPVAPPRGSSGALRRDAPPARWTNGCATFLSDATVGWATERTRWADCRFGPGERDHSVAP